MTKPLYSSMDALAPVWRLVREAGDAVSDPSKVAQIHAASEAGAAITGGVVGAGVGVAAVSVTGTVAGLSGPGIMSGLAYLGGLVAGGAAAGIAVAAAPAAVLAVGGYAAVRAYNQNKLNESRQALFQEALRKQQAVADALARENAANQERIDYLAGLNHQLLAALRDLRADIGAA